jgi:hypothetical protein
MTSSAVPARLAAAGGVLPRGSGRGVGCGAAAWDQSRAARGYRAVRECQPPRPRRCLHGGQGIAPRRAAGLPAELRRLPLPPGRARSRVEHVLDISDSSQPSPGGEGDGGDQHKDGLAPNERADLAQPGAEGGKLASALDVRQGDERACGRGREDDREHLEDLRDAAQFDRGDRADGLLRLLSDVLHQRAIRSGGGGDARGGPDRVVGLGVTATTALDHSYMRTSDLISRTPTASIRPASRRRPACATPTGTAAILALPRRAPRRDACWAASSQAPSPREDSHACPWGQSFANTDPPGRPPSSIRLSRRSAVPKHALEAREWATAEVRRFRHGRKRSGGGVLERCPRRCGRDQRRRGDRSRAVARGSACGR